MRTIPLDEDSYQGIALAMPLKRKIENRFSAANMLRSAAKAGYKLATMCRAGKRALIRVSSS